MTYQAMTYQAMTYQAIVTRYKGATNTRGSRVTATATGGRCSVEYDDGLSSEVNHAQAREKLVARLCWNTGGRLLRWQTGVLPNGATVHVAEGYEA